MSDETKQVDIEWCLKNALIFSGVKDRLLAELARLRAEAEAWRAVRERFETESNDPSKLFDLFGEIESNIAHLDQLKGEVK